MIHRYFYIFYKLETHRVTPHEIICGCLLMGEQLITRDT